MNTEQLLGFSGNFPSSSSVLIKYFNSGLFMEANDPAFKRRGDYDLVEVAKLNS